MMDATFPSCACVWRLPNCEPTCLAIARGHNGFDYCVSFAALRSFLNTFLGSYGDATQVLLGVVSL